MKLSSTVIRLNNHSSWRKIIENPTQPTEVRYFHFYKQFIPKYSNKNQKKQLTSIKKL